MAENKKISQLPVATLPITTGVKFEALQGGINVQVDADDMPGSSGGTSIPYGATSGTNTYTITASPTVTAYTDPMLLHIRVGNSSTSLVTLNVDGLGPKKLFDTAGTQAQDGYLKAGVDYLVVYNAALDTAAGGFTVVNELVHGVMNLRGTFVSAGGGVWPTGAGSGPSGGIRHGDVFIMGDADTLGAKVVNAGDFITTTVDNPGQTDSNWYVIPGPTSLALKAPLSTYYVASGTNDYTVTIPWITALTAGQSFDIQFTNANTAPVKLTNYIYPTLDINTLGAVPLKIHGAIDLSIGDIVANQIYRASYDGTNIQLVGKRLEEKVFNVEFYGAWHDYASVDDAAVSSGTTALTSTNANFSPNVTGKTMRVFGAGAAGVDLITTVTYVSESQVTLGVAASTTVSGAIIEWGHDDTAAIQAAIDACDAYGGGTVYFPAGVYFIAGALITSVDSINPNCQIYIPLNTVGVNRLTIKLKGEGGTTFNNGPLNNANITYNPRTGVILKSIIPGSGTTPSVFCSSFANNGFTDVNRNALILEDIAIQVKSRTGASHVAPTMTAWNLFYMGVTFLNNVLAFTESPVWVSVAPATGTYGIRFPRTSSNESYGGVHGFAFAQGFDIGIAIQEHDVWNRLTSVGCNKGFQIGQSGADGPHSIIGQQLHVFACVYGIEFTGGPNVHLSQVSIERYPGSFPTSRWYDGVADFLATSLSGASGVVKYNIISSGGAVATPIFSGTFGGQIKFQNLQADSFFIYLSGLTVNGDQPFEQLRYTGAAVSTSVSFPTFNMVHKQTGTANVVCHQNFINESSSASDKRLLQDSVLTNGSAQKGLRRVSMHSGTALSTVLEWSTDMHKTFVPEVIDADISPAQITANTDNYAPTGIGTAATLRLSTDASRNITGIAASQVDGRELTIVNIGAQNIVLMNNVTSTAANRFLLNADLTILPEQAVRLVYDGTSSRWRKLY